ncbi:elongator complex protein 6 isoform 1-T1 [Megaptera novaeangliae]
MPRQMAVSLCTTFSPSISKGVSLTTARERGQLVFLEGLKSAVDVFFRPQEEPHPLQFLREANSGNLQPLYEFVQEALKPMDSGEAAWRCPVLLVDDLSVLLSLGVGAVAVLDFVHYCRATVCRERKGNVVALVHDSGDAEDEENDILLNGLGHQSQLILRAEGLATGFCKDVHGQVRRGWGSLGAARLPSLGCPWDSVRLWGGLVGACLQVEGKPWKLCECRSQSAPSGAWPHAPRQVFHGGPFAAKGELLKRRWLSTGEGSKQRNSSAGPQQALYIQANTVPFKIETWDFPGGAVVKNPPANAEDLGSSPGPGRSHMPRSN